MYSYYLPDIYKKEKKVINADVLDFVGLVVSFLSIYFFIEDSSVSLWAYLAFWAFSTVYITLKKKHFTLRAGFFAFCCLITALPLWFAEYSFLLSFLLLIPFTALYLAELGGVNKHVFGSYLYLCDTVGTTLSVPFKGMGMPLKSLINLFKGKEKKSSKLLPIALGALCALPIIAVAMVLLISGDAAFEFVADGFVEKILTFSEDLFYENDIIVIIIALILTPFIYSLIFHLRYENNCGSFSEEIKRKKKIPSSAMAGFLGAVSLLYLIYLFSQTAYFFSAFTGNLPKELNFTVSEYAVRGFFEMLALAAINLGLIVISVLFCKRDENKIKPLIKAFNFFLCGFTLVLIVTSVSKIALYIASYGLTDKRFWALVGNALLFVTFICIIIRLFKEKFPYMKIITVFACSLLGVINLVNPTYVIGTYNVNAYLSGMHKEIDLEQIYYFDDYYSLIFSEKILKGTTNEKVKDRCKATIGEVYYRFTLPEYESFYLYKTLTDNIVEKNKDLYREYYSNYSSKFNKYQGYYFVDYGTEVTEQFNIIVDTHNNIKAVDILYYYYDEDETDLERYDFFTMDIRTYFPAGLDRVTLKVKTNEGEEYSCHITGRLKTVTYDEDEKNSVFYFGESNTFLLKYSDDRGFYLEDTGKILYGDYDLKEYINKELK